MKKKVLSALLTAGMVVTMLAGCGNSGNSGNASVEQNRTASTESTASTETAVINMVRIRMKWQFRLWFCRVQRLEMRAS